jgi:WD40 repeat protein
VPRDSNHDVAGARPPDPRDPPRCSEAATITRRSRSPRSRHHPNARRTIDPQLILWNTLTGKQQWSITTELDELTSEGDAETIGKHAQAVDSVAISPTGLVATASSSRSIKIWSEHGKEKHLIEELKSNYWSIAISADSGVLAASIGYRIQRWGTAAANPLPDLRGHQANVTAVSYSEQRLASVAEDGSVCLWNALSGGRERALTGLRSRGTCVAFSPDGALVVAGSAGKNRGRR